MLLSLDNINFSFRFLFNNLYDLNHQIAWRFIFSAVLISPLFLLIITVRRKFSPAFRSLLFGACFVGLLLPYQRFALYFSDDLYLFIRHIRDAIAYDIFGVISVVWFIGFLYFFIARILDYRKTIRMFREGTLQNCAAYFHNFRSHIYLPPNFAAVYTEEEQKMLLAHEEQHIKQHDPFLYQLLVILKCLCWFNPLVCIAVRHFQHERELLCDKKVLYTCSEHEYGMLILKASAEQKFAVRAATAGIVMNHGSISERLFSLVKPVKTAGKISSAIVIVCMIFFLCIGAAGFRPAWRSLGEFSSTLVDEEFGLRELGVYKIENVGASLGASGMYGEYIEGMTAFVSAEKNGFSVDEKALYDYALSIGLSDESCLRINHIAGLHLDMGGAQSIFYYQDFKVGDLKTQEKNMDYTKDKNWFRILTDIFL